MERLTFNTAINKHQSAIQELELQIEAFRDKPEAEHNIYTWSAMINVHKQCIEDIKNIRERLIYTINTDSM